MMTSEEREWAYAVADACLDAGRVGGGGHTATSTAAAIDAFAAGAEWALAGMAVCEFMADLAAHVTACPECGGSGREFKHPEWDCYVCDGTGKRVTP